MTRKLVLISLVLCLVILCTPHLGFAQGGEAPSSDRIAAMMAEGWRPLTDGVLERHKGTQVENHAYGPEGMQWALQQLESRLTDAIEVYKAKPTPELKKTILKLKRTIEKINQGLKSGAFSSSLDKMLVNGCDVSFGYHADAYPLNPGPGVGATADSYLYNYCFFGEVYAEAKSYATNGGTRTELNQFDGPRYGYNISAYASTSVGGRQECRSSAYSYVYIWDLGWFFSASDPNDQCPDPPLTVSISGPSSTSILGYNCKQLTWYASASGGVPGYSFEWFHDGYSVGSGSSYTEWFCGDNFTYTESFTLSVTVTDSVGSQASASLPVTIYYRSSTCDPYGPIPLPICEPTY